MRGKRAKALRRAVYGEKDYRERSYFYHRDNPGTFLADHLRQAYQAAKRLYHGIMLRDIHG